MRKEKLIRGFLFACTRKSEAECLSGPIFATDKVYGPIVTRIRRGDLLFLNNVETDTLYGVFKATSNGKPNIVPNAFDGKYPYQVKVKPVGDIISSPEARRLLIKHGMKRNTPLHTKKLIGLLEDLMSGPKQLDLGADSPNVPSYQAIMQEIQMIGKSPADVDIEDEIPLIESTTFWDFPKQSYGPTPKGNNKYAGVTPA